MSDNRYQHELKRGPRLETSTVSNVNANGQPDLQSANRGYPRTEAENTLPENVYPGQEVVMLTSGDNDYPTIIGISPWLT